MIVNNPVITVVAPNNGGAGVQVSINGGNFMVGGIESVTLVSFAGVSASASFTIVSSTLLSVIVPVGAKNGLLLVSVPGKPLASTATAFEAEPVVTGITPTMARAGITTMTITGRNLCLASSVTFNAATVTLASVPACAGADLTSVAVLLSPSVTAPVFLVSVMTPSGFGTGLSAPTQASPGRVALLTSYASGFGGLLSLAPQDLKTLNNALYVTDPGRLRLFSVDIATGTFLASIGTSGGLRPIQLALFSLGTLTSVYASTDSLTSLVLGEASGRASLASLNLSMLASVGNGLMSIGPAIAAQRLASQIVWFSDWQGGQSTLLSVRAVDGVPLGSLVVGPGAVQAIGVNENAVGSLASVWYTTLTSIGVVSSPLAGATLRSFTIANLFALGSGVPAGLAFDRLGSVWIAAGTTLGVLTSQGSFAGLFNLSTLTSFGGGTPLVSSLAFDPSGNLWYADAGQSLIVLCQGGACGGVPLTSFALAPVGGTRPRVIAVDRLGSVWFDEPNAIERLMP